MVNTETHRKKFENVERDPRGTLTTGTGGPRPHRDYPPEDIKSERVMLWISPARQTIVDQTASKIEE